MIKDGKLSLVVKCSCHCTHTNENSDNGNQITTSEYGVSFKHFIVQFNSSFTSAMVLLGRFTKTISKCLNCNEFCTNEVQLNTQKKQRRNNNEILKPTKALSVRAFILVLGEIYCGLWFSVIFCAVLRFLIGPYASPPEDKWYEEE